MAAAVACHQAVTADLGHAEKNLLLPTHPAATAVFCRLIRLTLPFNQPLPENISHLSIYPHHALPLLLPINLLVSLWGGKLKARTAARAHKLQPSARHQTAS